MKTDTGASAVNTEKHRRQPLLGLRNSTLLLIISKEARSKFLFVSRFSPKVSVDDAQSP
jgi:hypothetical protein